MRLPACHAGRTLTPALLGSETPPVILYRSRPRSSPTPPFAAIPFQCAADRFVPACDLAVCQATSKPKQKPKAKHQRRNLKRQRSNTNVNYDESKDPFDSDDEAIGVNHATARAEVKEKAIRPEKPEKEKPPAAEKTTVTLLTPSLWLAPCEPSCSSRCKWHRKLKRRGNSGTC